MCLRTVLLGLILALSSLSCQSTPTGRRQLTAIPDDQMDALGAQAFADLKSSLTIETDKNINAYVKCVSRPIIDAVDSGEEWEIVVFREDSSNAFALPGGKIGVHTGLLKVAENQHQLATVLGHEIAHVIAEHGNERASQQLVAQGGLALLGAILQERQSSNYQLLMAAIGLGAQIGVLMPYGRRQESEADILGLDYMAQAGFNPEQSVYLWQNMARSSGQGAPEFLSTHPSHGTRIETLQGRMERAKSLYSEVDNRPRCQN